MSFIHEDLGFCLYRVITAHGTRIASPARPVLPRPWWYPWCVGCSDTLLLAPVPTCTGSIIYNCFISNLPSDWWDMWIAGHSGRGICTGMFGLPTAALISCRVAFIRVLPCCNEHFDCPTVWTFLTANLVITKIPTEQTHCDQFNHLFTLLSCTSIWLLPPSASPSLFSSCHFARGVMQFFAKRRDLWSCS